LKAQRELTRCLALVSELENAINLKQKEIASTVDLTQKSALQGELDTLQKRRAAAALEKIEAQAKAMSFGG